ncbi:hypothetical protein GGI42DRAFT_192805 [Trichoderma sp. SZMC 28013]
MKKWGPRGSLILLSALTFYGAAQVVHGMLRRVSLMEVWLQFCSDQLQTAASFQPMRHYCTLILRLRMRTTVLSIP